MGCTCLMMWYRNQPPEKHLWLCSQLRPITHIDHTLCYYFYVRTHSRSLLTGGGRVGVGLGSKRGNGLAVTTRQIYNSAETMMTGTPPPLPILVTAVHMALAA